MGKKRESVHRSVLISFLRFSVYPEQIANTINYVHLADVGSQGCFR